LKRLFRFRGHGCCAWTSRERSGLSVFVWLEAEALCRAGARRSHLHGQLC
jgi:hypothetical protein